MTCPGVARLSATVVSLALGSFSMSAHAQGTSGAPRLREEPKGGSVAARAPGGPALPGSQISEYTPTLSWEGDKSPTSFYRVTIFLSGYAMPPSSRILTDAQMQFVPIHNSGKMRGTLAYRLPACVLAPFQHSYKWTVALLGAEGSSERAASQPMYFRVGNPVRTSPSHRETVASAAPMLRWNAGAGGTFDIVIADPARPTEPLHRARNVTGNTYQVPPGVLKPGQWYEWTVHPPSCAKVTSYGTTPYCFFVPRKAGDKPGGWSGPCMHNQVDKP